VVWVQGSGEGTTDPHRIVLLDLVSGKRQQVGTFGAKQLPSRVAVSGPRIVYTVLDNGTHAVHLYDGRTRKDARITTDSAGFDSKVAISGDKVVFESRAGRVVVYDIPSRTAKVLAEDVLVEGNREAHPSGGLSIDGDRVVWSNDKDVFFYDLKADQLRLLNTFAVDDPVNIGLSISGNDVVWCEDTQAGVGHVVHHNLKTGTTRRIAQDRPLVVEAVVSDGKVVWADARNGNYDVYLYDLRKGKERAITASIVTQFAPVISGRRIVWRTVDCMTSPEGTFLWPDVDSFKLPRE
jgi:beta propeller repeat protein